MSPDCCKKPNLEARANARIRVVLFKSRLTSRATRAPKACERFATQSFTPDRIRAALDSRGQVVRPRFERSTIPVAFASRTCRQDAKTPSNLTGSLLKMARSGKASVLSSARLLSQNARCGNRPPHIQSNIIRFHGPVYFRLEKTALFFGVLSQ